MNFLLIFELGFLSSKFNVMNFITSKYSSCIFLGIFIYINMLLLNLKYFIKGINPFFNMFGNPFLFYGTAICAIIVLFILSYKLDQLIVSDNYFLKIRKSINIIYCMYKFIVLAICVNSFSFLLKYIPSTLFFILISVLCICIIMCYKEIKTIFLEKRWIIGKFM